MPKLDLRLRTVSSLISSATHADIGSDHGGLLVQLLRSKRVARGIAVEHKQQPLLNSTRALVGLPAEVRSGDGLGPIRCGEIDSLSLCGMGAELIVGILQRHPDRVPGHVVLQPNNKPDWVRRWGWENGFHLTDDLLVPGKQRFVILAFRRIRNQTPDESNTPNRPAADPAYEGIDLETAFTFGPSAVRQLAPKFVSDLRAEQAYFTGFPRLGAAASRRLAMITAILNGIESANRPTEPN